MILIFLQNPVAQYLTLVISAVCLMALIQASTDSHPATFMTHGLFVSECIRANGQNNNYKEGE